VSAATGVLIEHAFRGAHIQRILRLLLGLFFVAVLIFQPPDQHLALCWLVVICYALWSIAVGALIRAGGVRSLHYAWLALFVDVFTVAALTLIADSSAQRSWAPYLLINGFFLVPVIAAAQLNPWISAVVAVPAVLVYLGSSLLIRKIDADPISEIVLRTGLLAIVGIGCVLLSRVQRSRVSTIARLLDERTDLLAEMVTIEQREQRDLAETLHDGALQYVLAARQELEAVEEGIRRLLNGLILPWPRPPDCCARR
jgi:two-component system NarL family sensor kinase